MLARLSFYGKTIAAGSTLCLLTYALSQDLRRPAGFKDSLLDFIERNSATESVEVVRAREETALVAQPGEPEPSLSYEKGDWGKYIVAPRYSLLTEGLEAGTYRIEEKEEAELITYGSAKLNMSYGKSKFTKSSYRQYDLDQPVSRVIQSGFNPDNEMQLHMEGRIGERLTLYIDHDSRKRDNQYRMQYRAVRDDEAVREINAGEIDIKMNNSKYAVYDDTSSKGIGIDTTLRKGGLQVKAFGSVAKGETVVEYFRGNSSPGSIAIREYQYTRGTFYQIEPFKRYDALTAPPPPVPSPYTTLVTFTSSPVDPATYLPGAVNIDANGFEIYIDDQNSLNDFNAVQLSIDGGYYTKMVSGVDYTVNFSTGLVAFLKAVPPNARIFAVYTIMGSSSTSSDPGALLPGDPMHPGGIFANKIFVFIKYGYALHEDTDKDFVLDAGEDRNGDGKLNLDIYEVRSFYFVGERQIVQDNLQIRFYDRDQLLTKGDSGKLGRYSLDYSRGVIGFYLREPFKPLLPDSLDSAMYTENQAGSVSELTEYSMRVDYYREARSFQLQHFLIIPGSVRIKVNGKEIQGALYSIDYTSGFLTFNNPNNPVITPETTIEVKYEYMPDLSQQTQSFIGGVRADYTLNRDLSLGGTLLYSRTAGGATIPDVGNEPTQTTVLEGDATLRLSEKRLEDLVNSIPGVKVDDVPFDFRAYAEYARSYKNINTFGKALIDDMESTEEISGISLSDKDWIPSSMPWDSELTKLQLGQAVRGRLFFKYYRNPSSPDDLEGTGFTPYSIDYSKKPGPYNVATGHVADSIQSFESQLSLVFEYDFSAGQTHAPAVTRRLSSEAVDFSGLQYVELWYRGEGLTGDVNVFLDIGRIDEDSDGDGTLDTEDDNRNGFLDFDPSAGIEEDRGYYFNPTGNDDTFIGSGPGLNESTQGDGVLNAEDLNGNGVLETTENILRLPGQIAQDPTPITITPAVTGWQRARIYVKRSSLTAENLELLKQVEAIRLFLQGASGTAGKVYVDGIKFVSSRWRNIKINDLPQEDPDQVKVTVVDSINDADYRANAFLFARSGVYESLHGEKSDEELSQEQESALQVEYSLAPAVTGSVTRRFEKPMDIRFYKRLNMWIHARVSTPGDRIGVRVGSSESDYNEYDFANDYGSVWREVALNLGGDASGGVRIKSVQGNPDLKRVNYMEIIVYNQGGAATGKLWVNEIYVSEPEMQEDSAHWYEAEVRGKRPLFRTAAGVPVISDIHIKYIERGHGAQFSSVGKTTSDIKEKYRELFSSLNILPNWSAKADFIVEKSEADPFDEEVIQSKRGVSERKSIYVETDYLSGAPSVPSVKVAYKNDSYENSRDEHVASYPLTQETDQKIHTPSIIIKDNFEEVLGGRMGASLLMDTTFKDESIERHSESLSDELLEGYLPVYEKDKRQRDNAQLMVEYQGKHLFLQPSVHMTSQEVVGLEGKTALNDTQIEGDVEGQYHFPFVYSGDCKFVERNKKATLDVGLKNIPLVDPVVRMEFYYHENKFRDYDEAERLLSDDFSRAKDARSFLSSNFVIPLRFEKTGFKFIKNFVFSYMRSVFFLENEIPYEGEGESAFSEQYGISRGYDAVSDAALGFITYPPWYFFRGRGNFANGRDYAYDHLNEKLSFPGGTTVDTYGNSLRLIDNYAFNTTMDMEKAVLTIGSSLNQVCERQMVSGIPQQVLTFTAGSTVDFDLMQFFGFWFFRPNRTGIPYHSAHLNLGYDFSRNMMVTSNIQEDLHTPNAGVTFKWDRSSLGVRGSLDYRRRARCEYIPLDEDERDSSDDIFIENMQQLPPFSEEDRGYSFSALYETDVQWIYNLFSALYKLVALPIFNLEYSLLLNRYDYTHTVSPEPFDQHLVSGKLTLDLHKNVQGGLVARWALERFRNRDTDGINREIISYEVGLNFTLLF